LRNRIPVPAVVAVLATMVALSAGAGAAAATPRVATGRYVGKTSQGQAFKFKIESARCDSPRPPFTFHSALCFQGEISNRKLSEYYPKVLEPCSNGTTYSDALYAASYQLSLTSAGFLSYTVHGLGLTLQPNASLTTIKLQVKGSRASGTLRQTESYDTGAGDVYCDSKTVTFTARKTG
jgi:hypothetical protein